MVEFQVGMGRHMPQRTRGTSSINHPDAPRRSAKEETKRSRCWCRAATGKQNPPKQGHRSGGASAGGKPGKDTELNWVQCVQRGLGAGRSGRPACGAYVCVGECDRAEGESGCVDYIAIIAMSTLNEYNPSDPQPFAAAQSATRASVLRPGTPHVTHRHKDARSVQTASPGADGAWDQGRGEGDGGEKGRERHRICPGVSPKR